MTIREQADSSQNQKQALSSAPKRLYSAFNRYKLHGPVSGCSHCTSEADDQRLRSKPLHELSGNDLERFAFKAVTTLGTVEDLKHFLPRLLEIAAGEGRVGDTEFEIVLGKLDYAGWRSWPKVERTAIEDYLMALWRRVLEEFPSSPDANTCLCGIGAAVDNLSPWLEAWSLDQSLSAMQHLADFIDANENALLKEGRLQNAFWDTQRRPACQTLDWLLQPDTSARLEKAFFDHASEPVAAELSRAVDALTWVRARAVRS